jgi:hypothetical protein
VSARRRLVFAALVTLGLATATGAAAAHRSVAPSADADDDGAATPVATRPAEAFHATMDRAFGAGRWRQTSGYRSQAREDELRREGAGTVAPGHLSHHSMGSPAAPGAYDAVVPGMSSQTAAARLRDAGGPITRVIAEGAHGAQGPHLHIETTGRAGAAPAVAAPVSDDDTIYMRIVAGRRNPALGRSASLRTF